MPALHNAGYLSCEPKIWPPIVFAILPGPSLSGSYFSLFLSSMALVSTSSLDSTLFLSYSPTLLGANPLGTNCSYLLFIIWCFFIRSSSPRNFILSNWSLSNYFLVLFFSMFSIIFSFCVSISFLNLYSSTCSFIYLCLSTFFLLTMLWILCSCSVVFAMSAIRFFSFSYFQESSWALFWALAFADIWRAVGLFFPESNPA